MSATMPPDMGESKIEGQRLELAVLARRLRSSAQGGGRRLRSTASSWGPQAVDLRRQEEAFPVSREGSSLWMVGQGSSPRTQLSNCCFCTPVGWRIEKLPLSKLRYL